MNGHPAMMKVSDERRMKSPPALALVLVVMAWTVPPCGHIMTLDELRRPGIKVSFVFTFIRGDGVRPYLTLQRDWL